MSLKRSILSVEAANALNGNLPSGNRIERTGDVTEYDLYPVYKLLTPSGEVSGVLSFQLGPLENNQPNGLFIEDLVAVCLDRLEVFQKTQWNCYENTLAIRHFNGVLNALNARTERRKEEQSEGTLTPDRSKRKPVSVARDDYDDGIATYVMLYSDGTHDSVRREVREDGEELLSRLHGACVDPQLFWDTMLQLTNLVDD